ncbi:MAG: hypothetical protein JRI68_20340 [Deltaproteobacteria bacterium]|nr:hypothetical protein [Deltaproteobacteria bacterium]
MLLSVGGLAGCSDDEGGGAGGATNTGGTTSSSGSGGSTTGGSGGAGGSGGGQGGVGNCNALENEAPEVEIIQVAENAPNPTGGKFLDGLYHLTEIIQYTGPGGETGPTGGKQQETVTYYGPEVQVVVERFMGDGEQRFTLTYIIEDGGIIAYQAACPGPTNLPYDSYSWEDPDKLTVAAKDFGRYFVYTLIEAVPVDDAGAGG